METPRSLLEPAADFSPADLAGFSSSTPLSIRSLSLYFSPRSPSQTLIFVGTGGGKLLLFSTSPTSLQFLTSVSVTTRLIESIHVLAEVSKILVLSDGSLFLLDLLLSQPPARLGSVRDVVAVSRRVCGADGGSRPLPQPTEISNPGKKLLQKLANGTGTAKVSETKREDGPSCFISIVSGKKLVLVQISIDGVPVIWKEIQGIDGVKTIAWVNDSIIVGTLDGYTLFSVLTGKSTLIFSLPEASGPPRLKCLEKSKEVMLMVDNVGVVANDLGQPVGGSLVFAYAPESILEMGSYVVVGKGGRLDLYRRKTGVCVQSLSLGKGIGGPCITAGDDGGSGEIIVVGTTYKAFCYRKVPADEQIKDLLRKKSFKEAIFLVEEFESEGEMSTEMLSFVHAQVGFLLLFDLHFEEAVNHFLLSKDMQPSEIFPFIMRHPNRWSHLVFTMLCSCSVVMPVFLLKNMLT